MTIRRAMKLALPSLLMLAGCNSALREGATGSPRTSLRGRFHGGQQPISGATVQLYAASTSSKVDGAPATPLITSTTVTTAADGSFDITADKVCPSPSSLMYIVGTGGNPGLAPGGINPQLALMAALGPCGKLSAQPFLSINEVTTVAAVFALAPYMSGLASVGSTSADSNNLAAAFALANQLVDVSQGTVPGTNVPASLTIPAAEINTLADIVATCVNSAGGTAGDHTACGDFFSAATPTTGTAPTNTTDALVDIAQNSNNNVSMLYGLAPAQGPFQPMLPGAPANWRVQISPVMPQLPTLLGQYLLNEGTGTIASDTSGNGNDANIHGAPWEGSLDLNFTGTGKYIQLPTALNAARSFQFAIYNPPFGTLQAPQPPGYGLPLGDFSLNPALLCGSDQTHVCLIASNNATAVWSLAFNAFNTDHTVASKSLPDGWHVFTITCGSNSGSSILQTRYFYDGVETAYLAQGDQNTCPVPTSGNYQVGGSAAYDGSTWFVGKVAAVWAWSSILSPADASAAGSTALKYISSKGISTSFSQVAVASPLVLGGIDSRTYGVGVSPSTVWLSELQLTDPTYKTVNLGFPGQTLYDACIQYPLVFGPYTNPAVQPVITVLWGGVNDILQTGQTNDQIAANMQCLVQQAHAAGSKVVVATEISSNGRKSGDPGKDAFDPIIRANAFSWGADNIADLATDPMIGADGAAMNTNCFPDGVHPGPDCEPHITAILQDAINELLGSSQSSPTLTGAAAYQEAAGDRYLNLNGAAAQTVTLPDCIGYSLPRTMLNSGSNAATIWTQNGETLSGSGSIAAGATAIISPVPGSLATGGCSWSRTQ